MTTTMQSTQTYEGELLKVGSKEERDAMVASGIDIPLGWQFFDTTLGLPVWWNGVGGFRRADNTAADGIM